VADTAEGRRRFRLAEPLHEGESAVRWVSTIRNHPVSRRSQHSDELSHTSGCCDDEYMHLGFNQEGAQNEDYVRPWTRSLHGEGVVLYAVHVCSAEVEP